MPNPKATVELEDKEFAWLIAISVDAQKRIFEAIEKAAKNDNITKAYEGKDLFEVADGATKKLQEAFGAMPKTGT